MILNRWYLLRTNYIKDIFRLVIGGIYTHNMFSYEYLKNIASNWHPTLY